MRKEEKSAYFNDKFEPEKKYEKKINNENGMNCRKKNVSQVQREREREPEIPMSHTHTNTHSQANMHDIGCNQSMNSIF